MSSICFCFIFLLVVEGKLPQNGKCYRVDCSSDTVTGACKEDQKDADLPRSDWAGAPAPPALPAPTLVGSDPALHPHPVLTQALSAHRSGTIERHSTGDLGTESPPPELSSSISRVESCSHLWRDGLWKGQKLTIRLKRGVHAPFEARSWGCWKCLRKVAQTGVTAVVAPTSPVPSLMMKIKHW